MGRQRLSRWSSSVNGGIGAAYHAGSCLSFTLSPGIINEMYFPHVDSPITRDLQFLLTDGHTFYQEENRDLEHLTEHSEGSALLYRFTHSDREGRPCRTVRGSHVHPRRGPPNEEMAREQSR